MEHKILKEIYQTNQKIVAVQPYKNLFFIFTENTIYIWGEEKEIQEMSFGIIENKNVQSISNS